MFFEAMVVFNLAVLFFLYYTFGAMGEYLDELGESINNLWDVIEEQEKQNERQINKEG
jgi:hypothetical protein